MSISGPGYVAIQRLDEHDQKPVVHPDAGDGGYCAGDAYPYIRNLDKNELHQQYKSLLQIEDKFSVELGIMPNGTVGVMTPGGDRIFLHGSYISCRDQISELVKKLNSLDTNYLREQLLYSGDYYSIAGILWGERDDASFINGVPFANFTVADFYPGHALKSAVLAQDTELMSGLWFEGGTRAHFYNNDTLENDADVYSGTLKKDPTFEFYGATVSAIFDREELVFHQNQTLKTGKLKHNLYIPDHYCPTNS